MIRAYSIAASDVDAERKRVSDDLAKFDLSRVIKMDTLELPTLGPSDVHLRILAVSAEHNVAHAGLADTVNIVQLRGPKIYPGNSAVGEVIRVGNEVIRFREGDVVLTHCNGQPDDYGYPLRIWAYDQPASTGWYSEEAVVGDWQLISAPLECGLNLWQIAALPLRAPTAYHLWRRAEPIFRIKVSEEKLPHLNVLAFGGGVSELFLMLARARGHNAYVCSGSPERRAALERLGITTIDQTRYNRFVGGADIKAFGQEVKRLTEGKGMHLVCDMLRGPVFAASMAASAREAVVVSAGWQLGKSIQYDSAGASVKQLTFDHTHYETIAGCAEATALYGKVFHPTIHKETYAFEDLPRALQEMHRNVMTGIPIIRVSQAQTPKAIKLIP